MAQQTDQLALLFADISKSSIIYEQLGDERAQEIIGKILGVLSDFTLRHQGNVVKTVGDAVMATFSTADDAVKAAQAMQQTLADDFQTPAGIPPIYIHIGIHYGPVVVENGDVFGDAVNTAARVVDYANPRQIVATRAVIDHLPEESTHYTRYITHITAKNIAGEIELFEIVYKNDDTTTVIDSRKLAQVISPGRLYLTRGTQTIVVDRQNPRVSIGREDFNDISIRYSWISRTHAHIENHNGVFLLKDKSTNGTFIYPEGGEPAYIKKGEHPLAGKGIIIFGRDKDDEMNGELTDILVYNVR